MFTLLARGAVHTFDQAAVALPITAVPQLLVAHADGQRFVRR